MFHRHKQDQLFCQSRNRTLGGRYYFNDGDLDLEGIEACKRRNNCQNCDSSCMNNEEDGLISE